MIKISKRETTLLVILIILGFFLVPNLTKADFFNDAFNKITGFGTGPQSLSVSVKTNAIPVIGNVTTYDVGSGLNVVESGNTTIFFSFVVVDGDGLSDIVNNSAFANISRPGEATRYNDTFVNTNDGGCNAVNNVGINGKNFTCNISIIFYDGAGLWNISVRINDTSGAAAQNNTNPFTINELTALVISPNAISFPTVGLSSVNVSAISNITINNTGNDDISGRENSLEYINITAITLVGETSATTVIPTNNFSIGTDVDSGPSPSFCDRSRVQNTTRLVNTTATFSPYNNFSGGINGSYVLAQASGNFEILSVCLLDIPDDLTAQNYSTSKSGAWSISIW
ncbi:MAG: hypothetical protein AABX61_01750 [Nanoarchaeota archaeon]